MGSLPRQEHTQGDSELSQLLARIDRDKEAFWNSPTFQRQIQRNRLLYGSAGGDVPAATAHTRDAEAKAKAKADRPHPSSAADARTTSPSIAEMPSPPLNPSGVRSAGSSRTSTAIPATTMPDVPAADVPAADATHANAEPPSATASLLYTDPPDVSLIAEVRQLVKAVKDGTEKKADTPTKISKCPAILEWAFTRIMKEGCPQWAVGTVCFRRGLARFRQSRPPLDDVIGLHYRIIEASTGTTAERLTWDSPMALPAIGGKGTTKSKTILLTETERAQLYKIAAVLGLEVGDTFTVLCYVGLLDDNHWLTRGAGAQTDDELHAREVVRAFCRHFDGRLAQGSVLAARLQRIQAAIAQSGESDRSQRGLAGVLDCDQPDNRS